MPSQQHYSRGHECLISTLEKTVNFYLKVKHPVHSLEKGKRCLKRLYPVHCIDENSHFMTHNPKFALSDITN